MYANVAVSKRRELGTLQILELFDNICFRHLFNSQIADYFRLRFVHWRWIKPFFVPHKSIFSELIFAT